MVIDYLPGATEARAVSTVDPELEAAKSASFAQVLIRCARVIQEQSFAIVKAQLHMPDLRPVHLEFAPHLDLDGTRITELADRMGITKQAVFQRVEELERMGLLERVADPSDARSKLVRFTKHGRKALLAGIAVLKSLEGDWLTVVGEKNLAQSHRTLVKLLGSLEASRPQDSASTKGAS